MKTHAQNLFIRLGKASGLAVISCFCWCGCDTVQDASFTGRLWRPGEFVVPSPDPKPAFSQTPHGILVQYDAVSEHTGNVHRRAYYVEPNLKRVALGQRPVFVNPAKAGPQTVIPILPHRATNESPPEFYAVCSTNFCTFTIYRRGQVLGPCDLPVFKDELGTASKAALTPLAVTGDAAIVGSIAAFCVGAVWAMGHGATTVDP